MVKFGGKVGTLYQMLKNAFKKHPLQNRTNVQIKGGGEVKGLLNNVQKNFTFPSRWLPLLHIDWTFKEQRKLDFGRQLKLINLVLKDEEREKYQFKSGKLMFYFPFSVFLT